MFCPEGSVPFETVIIRRFLLSLVWLFVCAEVSLDKETSAVFETTDVLISLFFLLPYKL